MSCNKDPENCDLSPCECAEAKLKYGATADKYGLSWTTVLYVLTTYGPLVLDVVLAALKQGMTWDFIKQILEKFGPVFLSQAVKEIDNHEKRFGAGAAFAVVDGKPVYEGIFKDLLVRLVKEVLPQLVQEFGPLILDAILKAIVDGLDDEPAKLEKVVVAAISK